jgi:hypothetical protein
MPRHLTFRPVVNFSKLGRLCAFITLAIATSVAQAALILPDVSASVEAEASPLLDPSSSFITAPPATLPLSIQASNNGSPDNPGHAFASASVTGGLDPVVSVSVSAIGDTTTNPDATGSFIAGADAVLNYSFAIVGPDTTNAIPVLAQGNSSISQEIIGAFNSVQITTTLYVNNGSVLNTTGGPFSTTIQLHVGNIYDVHMEASAVVQVVPDQADAVAFVDPSFTIDPSLAGTYSIVYSAGLVPEPSSLALAAIGFVALATWHWRRR